mmetsp:Transcript_8324/g.23964  ORF Transcript_8324/g.23964 Transcript_8324/m.23964 type:complete len:100 (+) Transcript_8324:100-399(+)
MVCFNETRDFICHYRHFILLSTFAFSFHLHFHNLSSYPFHCITNPPPVPPTTFVPSSPWGMLNTSGPPRRASAVTISLDGCGKPFGGTTAVGYDGVAVF